MAHFDVTTRVQVRRLQDLLCEEVQVSRIQES